MTPQGMSYVSGACEKPLLGLTIGAQLDRTVARFPDNEALVVPHQGVRWRYGAFKEKVDALSAGLLALGLEPGDRLGIWSPNNSEWALTQFAAAKAGLILVNINPAYRLAELEYALNKVACRALVAAESFKSSRYLDMLRGLAPELDQARPGALKAAKLPHLETVVRLGSDTSAGMYNFAEVTALAGGPERDRLSALGATLQFDDPINIQFTSGTTGFPKGATLSHHNILNNGYFNGVTLGVSERDRVCIPVPLYHCFGMVMGNLMSACFGATMVYPSEAFDPLEVLRAVEAERCTVLYGVPTMFIAELDHPGVRALRPVVAPHRHDGGLALPHRGHAPRHRRAPHGGGDHRLRHDRDQPGELPVGDGRPDRAPGLHRRPGPPPCRGEGRGWGRQGRPLRRGGRAAHARLLGDAGLLERRGDDPRSHRRAGWMHSGDQATIDTEGYCNIVGRIKDMVIRGGENVYPREIEEFLYRHPKVQDVQVVGVPDEKYGEELCAWIKLRDGEHANADEIKAFCKDQIAHFKVPRYVRFVDAFPMTVTGKIQKFKMRETMIAELALAERETA